MRFIFWILIFFSPIAFSNNSTFNDHMNEEAKSTLLMLPYKPTYILPANYNEKIKDYLVYQDEEGDAPAQQTEIKYQISFKVPLFRDLGNFPISGYMAYTQVSFWQAYNSDFSSPFRETNYEPEAFLVWQPSDQLGLIGSDWTLKLTQLGLAHQSNGQTEDTSRSWNRLNGKLVFEHHNLFITTTAWHRFEEDIEDDNNPDLLNYYGHGEIALAYIINDNVFTITSRNNLESDFSQGSVSASWSFPIVGDLKGYIQAFSGYGNSLIEYNVYTNTIGIGISITDFL